MDKEALILTGLPSEISLQSLTTIAEKGLTNDLGIRTRVVDLGWKTRRNFVELEENLFRTIEEIEEKTVLIGIDIGSTMALIARERFGCRKISEIISVCGWNWPELGLRSSETQKLNNLRQLNPLFGDAIKKYTNLYVGEYDKFGKVLGKIEYSDWHKILTFVAKNDEVVPRNCNVIGPVMDVVEVRGNHVDGILSALTETKTMKEFIERK